MWNQNCGFVFRFFVEVNVSVDLVVGGGVGSGFARGVGDEVDSGVGGEVFEEVELEVGGNSVSINMSKMKSM